jgi:flagellar protein FlaG
MSSPIGPTPPVRPASATPKAPSSASFQATLAGVDTPAVTVDIGIPAVPPEDVRAAVGAAADRADQLAAANRELHFERDQDTGRVIVQVRDLATGEVIRTIPPSHALDVLSGGPL